MNLDIFIMFIMFNYETNNCITPLPGDHYLDHMLEQILQLTCAEVNKKLQFKLIFLLDLYYQLFRSHILIFLHEQK